MHEYCQRRANLLFDDRFFDCGLGKLIGNQILNRCGNHSIDNASCTDKGIDQST